MKVLDDVGQKTIDFFDYVGGVTNLLTECSRLIARFKVRIAETFNQANFLGVESLSIVFLTSLFTGMVFSLESAIQAVQYGVGNLVGGAVSFTTARELGPMLSSVVVAGRAGAAIAAELGSMAVTEQVEALESLGLSPVRMLVVPRFLALVFMLPVLAVFADVVSILGGMWLAKSVAGISYSSFLDSAKSTVGIPDFLKGLFKAAVFGAIIALIGSYQGLTTRGGAAGVGTATTRAVVISIILIFVSNFFLSYMLFGYYRR